MYVCAVTGPFPSGRSILRNIQHGPVIVNKERVTLAWLSQSWALRHVMLSEERAKHLVLVLEEPSPAGTGPFAFAQGDMVSFAALLWESPRSRWPHGLTFDENPR